MRRIVLAAAFLLLGLCAAVAQPLTRPCTTVGITCVPISASNPMPISGTITATISGGTVTGTGTAGTAATGVLTVQGIASMTPLLATVSQATAASLNATIVGSGSAGTAATGVVTVQGIASATPVLVTFAAGGYPSGSAAITGNATGTTGAVVGTLAGVSAKTTYICGFSVSAIGGVAAVGPVTIAGTVTSSLVYYLASSAVGTNVTQTFSPCIPASATNTPITTTTTADGTASNVAVNSWGFQQ